MGTRSNVVILKNMFTDRAIYCPCCGKDIKVIEEDDDSADDIKAIEEDYDSADDIWKVGTFTVEDGCLFGIVDLKYH